MNKIISIIFFFAKFYFSILILMYFFLKVPEIFSSSEDFDEWFDLKVSDDSSKERMIHQLHRILRPFMLRRLKADVAKDLPPKVKVRRRHLYVIISVYFVSNMTGLRCYFSSMLFIIIM